ncbi:hypothetical protein NQ176_g9033 [Zarea fungicola]|uniref:Uncharacterized protein n=1 Tax=Zarea fungicola TaxID=93591 RepID=A0ACC1MP03_9HYPO|nr:hypothetical protein NQ176_g9033 [Lecanicillium fungicola]
MGEEETALKAIVRPPCTPTAFLQHVLKHYTYPTTVLICAAKQDFLNATASELRDATPATAAASTATPASRLEQDHEPLPDTEATSDAVPEETLADASDKRSLLKATLAQISTARHIHTVFIPSVAHLRAYLSVFPHAAQTTAPPPPPPAAQIPIPGRSLIVYGFLDVHRDGSEWSAQGIGCSAACIVEAAVRSGCLETILMEPTGWDNANGSGDGGGTDGDAETLTTWGVYQEQIPLLSTTASVRDDGTWGLPCTSAKVILRRWFTFHDS